MSAHEQMRAMLDQLMGTARNGKLHISCLFSTLLLIYGTLVYLPLNMHYLLQAKPIVME